MKSMIKYCGGRFPKKLGVGDVRPLTALVHCMLNIAFLMYKHSPRVAAGIGSAMQQRYGVKGNRATQPRRHRSTCHCRRCNTELLRHRFNEEYYQWLRRALFRHSWDWRWGPGQRFGALHLWNETNTSPSKRYVQWRSSKLPSSAPKPST